VARSFLDDGRIEFRPRAAKPAQGGTGRRTQRVRQLVRDRLAQIGIDATTVSVTVADGVVRLVGTVPDARTKQAAERAAAQCAGVRDVDSRLRVRRSAVRSP
jgi:osmotically-inducible protein OsmY